MRLNYLSLLLLSFYFNYINAEHRKLIPKCFNSCFNGPESSNCFCDSKCSLIYNDCCLDAPYRSFRVNIQRVNNIHCVFVHGENKHFWMVETCKDSWTGPPHIKEKCTQEKNPVVRNNIIADIPVTSPKEEVTYKNYYCGLCNDEDPEDLVEWQVKALCNSRDIGPIDVLQNLTYVEEELQWGVWKEDDEGYFQFHECYLLFQKPRAALNGIRQCVSNMVSTCPASWRNMATRRKCKSYVDPIQWPDGAIYKNIDCAVCHNETSEGYRCVYDVTKDSSAAMLKLAMPVDMIAMGQWF